MITGLNHITLAVSDLENSLYFYTELLDFKAHVAWESGAYLSAGPLWLCLFVDEVCSKDDYTHFAFSVCENDFIEFSKKIEGAGILKWKENKSHGSSLYFLDPDGHKLELHAGDLESRLRSLKDKPYRKLKWLR